MKFLLYSSLVQIFHKHFHRQFENSGALLVCCFFIRKQYLPGNQLCLVVQLCSVVFLSSFNLYLPCFTNLSISLIQSYIPVFFPLLDVCLASPLRGLNLTRVFCYFPERSYPTSLQNIGGSTQVLKQCTLGFLRFPSTSKKLEKFPYDIYSMGSLENSSTQQYIQYIK